MSDSRNERIYQLDLFRVLAALLVVGFHYFHMGPFFGLYGVPSRPVESLARYGYLGVQAFFMISGFVIVMSAQGKSAGEFLRGRLVRLMPLFWVACLLTFAVTTLVGPAPLKVGPASLLASLVMLPAFTHQFRFVDGVYWTLACEWLFYAGMALVLATGLYERHLNKVLTCWLALSAGMLWVPGGHWLLRMATVAEYSPYFVAGVCFYRFHTKQAEFHDLFNLGLSFMLAVKWSQTHVQEFATIYPLSGTVVLTLVCALFAVFMLLACRKLEWLNRKVFELAGAPTYALYLVHQNIGYVVLGSGGNRAVHLALPTPPVWAVVATMTGACALAVLLNRAVEQPAGRRLKRLFRTRRRSVSPGWQPLTLDDMRFDHD